MKKLKIRPISFDTLNPDLDDISNKLDELENGNLKVGVHIADVSHYVKKDSALDKHALLRGNSVYLVGKVIPMLPEKLSNGVCSLVPNEDRFTFSVILEITNRGKIVSHNIAKTIINSKRRFSYEEAQEIIETNEGDFSKEIILLNNLARTLRKLRVKAVGGLAASPSMSKRLSPKSLKSFSSFIEKASLDEGSGEALSDSGINSFAFA